MIFTKKLLIFARLAFTSFIFASGNEFVEQKEAAKCAIAAITRGITEIDQLVDVNTGNPSKTGWSIVKDGADIVCNLYKSLDAFSGNRLNATATWFIGFTKNVDRAFCHRAKNTRVGHTYIWAKGNITHVYSYLYNGIYSADNES